MSGLHYSSGSCFLETLRLISMKDKVLVMQCSFCTDEYRKTRVQKILKRRLELYRLSSSRVSTQQIVEVLVQVFELAIYNSEISNETLVITVLASVPLTVKFHKTVITTAYHS